MHDDTNHPGETDMTTLALKADHLTDTLKTAALPLVIAAGLVASAATEAPAEMSDTNIDLTYVWTAHPGMEAQLIAAYDAVGDLMLEKEPGVLFYEIAVSETGNQIVIRETFEDGAALGYHLSSTAAQYFPQLTQIATPGPFIFKGDVPEELKMAAYQMDMGAIFTGDWSGFTR